MKLNFFTKIRGWFKQKKFELPIIKIQPERNYMDDVVTLRDKIKKAGWQVRELPMRNNDIVKNWKIIAIKGEKSIHIGGITLDQALRNLTQTLGIH